MAEIQKLGYSKKADEEFQKAFSDMKEVFKEVDKKFDELEDNIGELLRLAEKLAKTDDPKKYEKFARKFKEKSGSVKKDIILLTTDPRYKEKISNEVRDFLKEALEEMGNIEVSLVPKGGIETSKWSHKESKELLEKWKAGKWKKHFKE
jgi:hypothetical protein